MEQWENCGDFAAEEPRNFTDDRGAELENAASVSMFRSERQRSPDCLAVFADKSRRQRPKLRAEVMEKGPGEISAVRNAAPL